MAVCCAGGAPSTYRAWCGVGLSVHHRVQSVSLDALVEQRMRSSKVHLLCHCPLAHTKSAHLHIM